MGWRSETEVLFALTDTYGSEQSASRKSAGPRRMGAPVRSMPLCTTVPGDVCTLKFPEPGRISDGSTRVADLALAGRRGCFLVLEPAPGRRDLAVLAVCASVLWIAGYIVVAPEREGLATWIALCGLLGLNLGACFLPASLETRLLAVARSRRPRFRSRYWRG